MTGRPTLESVAHEAQVSRQTVSNVLNSPDRVAAPTLARVREVIGRLGYRPDQAARQLRTRRSGVIGVRIEPVLDGVNGVVLDLFRHAITESAQRLGYRILLFTAADDTAEIGEYETLVGEHGLDAFVVTGTHHGDLRTAWLGSRAVPFVTFGRPWGVSGTGSPLATPIPHAWVDVDGAAGTRAATDALVADGHRRIAFLGWPSGSGAGDDRRAGWVAGAAAHRLPRAGLDTATEDGVAAGTALARELLDRGPGRAPSALICASDSLALGALAHVRDRGLKPGSDIGIVGFDDTPVAAAVGLSSVAQPVAAAAENCLQLLDDQVRSGAGPPPSAGAGPPGQRLLAPELVIRDSGGRGWTRPPRRPPSTRLAPRLPVPPDPRSPR